jgi:rRNA maturation RNase YbeY
MPSYGRQAAGMGSAVSRGSLEVMSELKGSPAAPRAWAKLLEHYLGGLGYPKATMGLLFCGDRRSHSLNKSWMGKDRPTDVLSFPLTEGRPKPGFAGHLGEVVINLPYIRRKLGRYADTLESEAAFLVLHGTLHLIGIHHDSARQEAAMWRISRRNFPPPPAVLRGLALTKKTRKPSRAH